MAKIRALLLTEASKQANLQLRREQLELVLLAGVAQSLKMFAGAYELIYKID